MTYPYVNHWACGAAGGDYGANYHQRTAASYVGIRANNPGEVVYFSASRDSNQQVPNGSNSYVMHFAAGALPDTVVNAYWSVILVGVPDYRVVPNPLKRYNFNNDSPLTNEADGSLKIAAGPKPVAGVPESNWLPSAEGKPFSLTFRIYVPKGRGEAMRMDAAGADESELSRQPRRSLLLALRVISRRCSNSVAFRAKRTFIEPRLSNRI